MTCVPRRFLVLRFAAGSLFVLCLLTASFSAAWSQLRLPAGLDGLSGTGFDVDSGGSNVDPVYETALEEPVDPTTYLIIPGDRMALGIWGERPETHELSVTPEGDLVLPHSGPESVAGKTLADSERAVQAQLRRLYPYSKITLRLLEPGKLRVAVVGRVAKPGWYELTGLDRVSAALDAAGGISFDGSERFIRVHSRSDAEDRANSDDPVTSDSGAESQTLNILPWLFFADLDSNPRVNPGWRIEVPSRNKAVLVTGAVHSRNAAAGLRASTYFEEEPIHSVEWQEGDTVDYALGATGGLTADANGTLRLIHRDGTESLLDALDSSDLGTLLRAGDRLEVSYSRQWIYVVGSVRRPGRYPTYPGYLAADYVRMAGGETPSGSADRWTVTDPVTGREHHDLGLTVGPGTTIRVPERRSAWLTRIITPFASAVAIGLSVVALTR